MRNYTVIARNNKTGRLIKETMTRIIPHVTKSDKTFRINIKVRVYNGDENDKLSFNYRGYTRGNPKYRLNKWAKTHNYTVIYKNF